MSVAIVATERARIIRTDLADRLDRRQDEAEKAGDLSEAARAAELWIEWTDAVAACAAAGTPEATRRMLDASRRAHAFLEAAA